MAYKFVIKKFKKNNTVHQERNILDCDIIIETPKKNNKKKKENDMNSVDKIAAAELVAENMSSNGIKVVKKDKGLIERTESSKIILTEDNRQVLND